MCEREIANCKYQGSRVWNTIYELCRQLTVNPSEVEVVKPFKCAKFIKLEGYKRTRNDRDYDLRNVRKM
jgi:hypothetical protein